MNRLTQEREDEMRSLYPNTGAVGELLAELALLRLHIRDLLDEQSKQAKRIKQMAEMLEKRAHS